MKKVVLRNNGSVSDDDNLYFPRLQVNGRGEIILAISKSKNGLTKGILVGTVHNRKSKVPIGQLFTDWEVAGELEDYDGEVNVTIRNQVKRHGEVTGMRFIDKYKGHYIYRPYGPKNATSYLIMEGFDFIQQSFASVRACKRYINEKAA